MSIKIKGEMASITIWTAHPLSMAAADKLPSRVLDLLHTELKTGPKTLFIEEVPVENVSHFIDYRFAKMRMELTEYQLLRKFFSIVYAFVLGMFMWTFLYFFNQQVIMTALISIITVFAMCSLFSRRFMYTIAEDKALHDLYVYFIKEHQYSYATIAQSLSKENTQITEMLTNLDEHLKTQTYALKEEEHKRIYEKEKANSENREIADGFNRLSAAYQDLLNHTEPEMLDNHFDRCRGYGIEIYYDDDLTPPTDTIH